MSSLNKGTSRITSSEDDAELRRGPWTVEEDTLLIHYITRHGEGRWNLLAKRAGLRRTGKSCRLRWLNYLKPDVKRGNLSPQELLLILDLHSKWGNRWSKIAQHLPGRTDNEIKNYWRTRVQKQARHLKIDPNSTAFQEIIRFFWMPRLLQKIKGSLCPPPSALLPQNPTAASHQPVNYGTQNLALPPLTQGFQAQGPPNSMSDVFTMRTTQHHDPNSDSEHGTSTSCIPSTESLNISQISQFSEYPTSHFHANLGNNSYLSTLVKDCYNVDGAARCDMYSTNLANLSPAAGCVGNPVSDCRTAEGEWFGFDFGEHMWNIDE